MGVGQVGAFWLVSLLLVMTPGADWAYVITAGLRYRSVLPAVAGLLAAHVTAALAASAGIAALVAGVPLLLSVLTALGAAYLIWLGTTTYRRAPVPHAGAASDDADSNARQLLKGFGVSGLNPKLFLLFVALLPQFTNPHDPWPVALQTLGLSAVHLANTAVVYTAVGIGARAVLRARPAAARVVSRCSGVAMVGIGLVLLVEQAIR